MALDFIAFSVLSLYTLWLAEFSLICWCLAWYIQSLVGLRLLFQLSISQILITYCWFLFCAYGFHCLFPLYNFVFNGSISASRTQKFAYICKILSARFPPLALIFLGESLISSKFFRSRLSHSFIFSVRALRGQWFWRPNSLYLEFSFDSRLTSDLYKASSNPDFFISY